MSHHKQPLNPSSGSWLQDLKNIAASGAECVDITTAVKALEEIRLREREKILERLTTLLKNTIFNKD